MNNRSNKFIQAAICTILVSMVCGVGAAQDFGNLPESKHTVRVACLSDDVESFCGTVAKQLKKNFKVKDAEAHGTYSLIIGGHEATDANDPDPFFVVYGILTRTVVYKNSEDSDPEVANHFRRIRTIGTPKSDFRVEAQRFAELVVRDIQKDIAKIQR